MIDERRFQLLNLRSLCAAFAILIFATGLFAMQNEQPVSQEMSDAENVPVLLKHLPDWESKRDSALFFSNDSKFHAHFNERSIIRQIDFIPGTEAVVAKYDEGELLIVEYTTPQASSAIDKDVLGAAGSGNDAYIYRRIGNYNVFLFDPSDEVSAGALLEQVKYEKVVTWPYGNPHPFFARERAFILGTTSLFISTVFFILSILGAALLLGAVIGVLYFRANTRRRASMAAFSDSGGLTRLNLDGLTQEMSPEKLLKE